MSSENKTPQELSVKLIGRCVNILKKENVKSNLTGNKGLTLDYSSTLDEIASLYENQNEESKE